MDRGKRKRYIILLLYISVQLCLASGNYDEHYIGCYKDNATNPDLESKTENASMTISFCVNYCRANRRTYAGIQNGTSCFCGDLYGRYGLINECSTVCAGNRADYCGGNLANSIYAVCPIGRHRSSCDKECHCANEAPCYLSNGTCPNNVCAPGWSQSNCSVTSVPVSSLSYHGCFNSFQTEFPLKISHGNSFMTITWCMDFCRAEFSLYAGVQFSYQCACGNNSYARNGISSQCGSNCLASHCSCSGSSKDRCGGPNANDVYSVCQFGYYGVLCSQRCHCRQPTINCTMENGTCSYKECASGWTESACNIRNCSESNGDCSRQNEICKNEVLGNGRYVPRCRCRQGYNRKMEHENCTDIDECSLGQPDNQCNPTSGICRNIQGSYSCTCKTGYENKGAKVCQGNYYEQYIGCYKDNAEKPDLENRAENASMTILYCLNNCRANGRTYAGIRGTLCFCGDDYGKYGLINECRTVCQGYNSDYCGGNMSNSIYAVCPIGLFGSSCDKECHCANEAPCFVSNGTCPNNNCASGWSGVQCSQTSVSVALLSYHGCFIDARTNGFPLTFEAQNEMTITLCMDRCRTRFNLYAGLQYSYSCFCGNGSYAANGSSVYCGLKCGSPYTNCSCPGSPKDRCGGSWANDVYSVCQFGYYGVLCSQRCHCRQPTINCTMENGTCLNEECASGWTGSACNIRNCKDNNGDCSRQNEICQNEELGNDRYAPRCRCRHGYKRTMEYENCTENYDEQYIGCYKDNAENPDLENKTENASMTILYCLNYCQTINRTYAAIKGTLCFCGDDYGKYGVINECSTVCAGNNADYCGGNMSNSIYAVCPIGRYGSSCNMECHCANEAPCSLSNGSCPSNICASGWSGIHCNQTSVPVSSLSYHGCFNDTRDKNFPQIPGKTGENMTITLCMDRCKTGFNLYAGLQYGYECFCGNSSYAANGPSVDCGLKCGSPYTNCNCSGSLTDRCGGSRANDVYSVCQFGYYGVLCSQRCHCRQPTANCTMENGTCSNKECASGWTGSACNIRNCSDNNGSCSGQNEICQSEALGKDRYVSRCRCSQGYNRTMEYENCTDIDECSLSLPYNQCDAATGICNNTQGSYNCTCKPGYENNGTQACQDIDECSNGTALEQCKSSTGNCINVPGDYNCSCYAGYTNIESHSCQDIDECLNETASNQCTSSTGNCTNFPGDYICSCYAGYISNGNHSCQDVDECLWQEKNGCDNKTTRCQNTLGSFSCHCLAGYMQDASPMKCLKVNPPHVIGAIAGTLCAILIILAVAAVIYFYRNGWDCSKLHSGKRKDSSTTKLEEIKGQSSNSVKVTAIAKIPENIMREEFKSVPMEAEHPSDYAADVTLKVKNKYKNILPYNHNRVKLQQIDGYPKTDYINASHIRIRKNQKLIASHGPQMTTLDDFWRMIWEQDVGMIVMFTRCIENGKKKCEQYWPENRESKEFGTLTVTTIEEDDFADYSVRTLRVDKDGASRTVRQCHFLAWPDHDVPTHSCTLLKFRQVVQKLTPEKKSIVVHCSAGVGRTGTYIAIDSLLHEAKETSPPCIDALRCLQNLRDQRMHMIQTEAQYMFVYLAISEAYTAGETLLSCSEFRAKYSQASAIEREFQALEKMKKYMTDDDKYDALLPVNYNKNRDINIVPAGRDRVLLLNAENGRNDYINAVFCQNIRSKEAYIQTQLPLPETIVDFWNMISDYSCQHIVLFDEDQRPDFIPTLKAPLVFENVIVYWKSECNITGGVSYSVRLVSKANSQKDVPEAEESIYMNTEIGTVVTVNIITAKQHGMFDHQSMLALYNTMRAKYRSDQKSRIPLVVMCENACTYSSVYICMSNIFDMIDSQNEVDIFQTVYEIRMKRPQAIESMFFYEQLYALIQLKLQCSSDNVHCAYKSDSDAVYANT